MPASARSRPLWRCRTCGRRFANRNQAHACGRYRLSDHFAGKPPFVRRLFRDFLQALRRIGPVIVLPEKSRIAFQVRMSFAQVSPRRTGLVGHLVLARPVDDVPLLSRRDDFRPEPRAPFPADHD